VRRRSLFYGDWLESALLFVTNALHLIAWVAVLLAVSTASRDAVNGVSVRRLGNDDAFAQALSCSDEQLLLQLAHANLEPILQATPAR